MSENLPVTSQELVDDETILSTTDPHNHREDDCDCAEED
jgi:hypothetical protein